MCTVQDVRYRYEVEVCDADVEYEIWGGRRKVRFTYVRAMVNSFNPL